MKRLFVHTIVFAALAVVFSALTGCGGTEQTNLNGTNSAGNAAAQKQNDSSAFPPLASGLADAELPMLDGAKFKLADKKGKVLLVNIWGTWCGPCIDEMPHLRALQTQYSSQGFEVIGLNIGDGDGSPEPIDAIRSFVAKQELNYTIAIAPNAVTNQFYAITKQSVVPQTILVDREGRLRGVFVGGGPRIVNSMRQTVAKLMGEG